MPELERLGRYRIIKELGRGGMGVVYLAQDEMLDRPVAIKTVTSPSDTLRDRLRREARLSARLNHPCVIRLHDIGEANGLDYLVLEYVDGRTLRDVVSDVHRMRQADAVRLLRDAALGVAHAHGLGIVHRDLKPENVMVTTDGHAKVMDFGLAWQAQQAKLTRTGFVMGTVAYFSPEQARGEPADERSDLYSLGAILFELLTGRMVFEATSVANMITQLLQAPPPSVASLAPHVPPELDRLVQRCLQKAPSERYPSVNAMLAELEPLLELPALTPRSAAPPQPTATAWPTDAQWGPFQRAIARMQENQVVTDGGAPEVRPVVQPSPDSFDDAYRKGKAALDGGRIEEALQHLHAARRLNRQDARPYRHIALAHARQNQFDRAMEACRKGLALAPDHARIRAHLGDLLARTGQRAEAIAEYEKAVRTRGDLVEPWRGLAALYLAEERVADSVRAFEKVLKLQPNDVEAACALPRLYLKQQNPAKAEQAARAAAKLLPDDPERYLDLARALEAAHKPEAAVQMLHRATQLDASNVAVWERLAALHVRLHQPGAAKAVLKDAIMHHNGVARLHWQLGEIYASDGRYGRAAELFERALGLRPALVEAQRRVGEPDDLPGDVATLEEAVQKFPVDAGLREALAIACFAADPARALEEIRKATTLDATHAGMWRLHGWMAEAAGRTEEAINALQRALELDSRDLQAATLLGRLYVRQGRAAAAAEILQHALLAAPKDMLLHFLLGQARRMSGHHDRACRSFRRAWDTPR